MRRGRQRTEFPRRGGTGLYPELSGKVALVTGATRGFGRAIALRLAAEGVRVAVNYRRSRSEAEGVVREIAEHGGAALPVRFDVGDEAALRAACQELLAQFTKVDIVVSNAAFGVPGTVMDAKSKHWTVTMSATAQALQWLAQSLAPAMEGWGRIVSISSEGGSRVLPGYGVVGVAKSALEALTRTLEVELAPRGILVNGVIAGAADTRSFRAIPGSVEYLAAVAAGTPVGRTVTPEDVADVVAFLCSDQARMICGQFVVADGGRSVTA